MTGESLHKCLEYAAAALTIDSTYAPAHALTSLCYTTLPNIGQAAPSETFPKANAAARRALELDEGIADAHFALGWTLANYDWSWSGAEREFRRGLELNPSSSFGHSRFGWFLSWLGRFDEALGEVTRGEQLNPAGPYELQALAAVHYVARRYDEAIVAARRAIEVAPANVFGHIRLGSALSEVGRHEEAIAALETAVKLSGDRSHRGALGRADALAGRPKEARRQLEELLNFNQGSYLGPIQIAMIYVGLGEKDEALRWLKEGYRVRDANMVLWKVWPGWDPLRADPRFQDLLRRMKFP